MTNRLRAALAHWVDTWRAEREEHRDHDGQRDDETLVRWLRTANQRLGARHWRRFRQR